MLAMRQPQYRHGAAHHKADVAVAASRAHQPLAPIRHGRLGTIPASLLGGIRFAPAETVSNTASLAVIGVDIGKEVLHLVGFGVDGKIAFRRRIRRLGLKDAFEKLPPCIVGMEACLSAHFVSRTLRALGHQPRIIPAIYV